MNIKEFIEEKGIKSLYHFTKSENLYNILKYGLLSRATLDNNEIDYDYNDEKRLENKLNAICTSISFPNYKMFYKYRQEEPNSEWCVIELDPSILYEKNCLFCISNAASKSETNRNDLCKTGLNGLKLLFDADGRSVDLASKFTTNPQAEVLVLGNIEQKYIKRIVFDTNKPVFKHGNYPKFRFEYDTDKHLFYPRADYANWQLNYL